MAKMASVLLSVLNYRPKFFRSICDRDSFRTIFGRARFAPMGSGRGPNESTDEFDLTLRDVCSGDDSVTLFDCYMYISLLTFNNFL